MASPQTIENIRDLQDHYGANSTRAGAFQPLAGYTRLKLKPRVPKTDSPIADLCTRNPPTHAGNSLKNNHNKAEETAACTLHFYLTTERFRFMIISVPGFTERLAEQGEHGFRALIRGENRKSAPRGAKDNRASGEASLLW
jgi:hypothetical protein